MLCDDCKVELDGYEYAYMVWDELWAKAKMSRGYLCIGCLEDRLGRELRSADFKNVPLNWSPYFTRSPRLLARLAS